MQKVRLRKFTDFPNYASSNGKLIYHAFVSLFSLSKADNGSSYSVSNTDAIINELFSEFQLIGIHYLPDLLKQCPKFFDKIRTYEPAPKYIP